MLAMRLLEQRGYVCTTRQRDPDGRSIANKITLLPLAKEKKQRVLALAKALDTTPGIAIMCLDRLVATPKPVMRMSLAELEAVTGYPDGRRLAIALGDHGFIRNDQVDWS